MGSEKAGWLVPQAGFKSDKVEDVLGGMVQALCAIPAGLVRPRFQEQPASMPGNSADCCAFGVIGESAPGGAAWHEMGHSRLDVDQEMDVLFSFYGANAREKARALRDGLWIEQNRAMLRLKHNIALVSIGSFRFFQELVNNRWLNRCDLSVKFMKGPPIARKTGKDTPGFVDIHDLEEANADIHARE